MKEKTNRLFCLILVFDLLIPIGLAVGAFSLGWKDVSSASGRYEYPVTPQKTPERWKQMDHGEIELACQIPEDVLPRLSTKELLLSCLDYPLFGDLMAYGGDLAGFDAVKTYFNGLQALWEREDLSPALAAFFADFFSEKRPEEESLRELYPRFLSALICSAAEDGKITDADLASILSSCRALATDSRASNNDAAAFFSLAQRLSAPDKTAVSPLAHSAADGRYEYPVTPQKTPERWKQMDHGEIELACQIPEDVLPRLSTKELLLSCLDYPLFGDLMAYGGDLAGFDAVKTYFNGLQALWEREDLSPVLASLFEELAEKGIAKEPSPELRLSYLSVLTRAASRDRKLREQELSSLRRSCQAAAEKAAGEKSSLLFSRLRDSLDAAAPR